MQHIDGIRWALPFGSASGPAAHVLAVEIRWGYTMIRVAIQDSHTLGEHARRRATSSAVRTAVSDPTL